MPNYDMNSLGAYTKYRLGIRVDREVAGISAGETDALYSVVGGAVQVNLLFGVVTTIISAACVMLLHYAADVAANHFDLSIDSADFDTDAVGTMYIPPATIAGALTTDGGGGLNICPTYIFPPGELMIHPAGAVTGTIKWSLFYVPLVEGAYVVAHA